MLSSQYLFLLKDNKFRPLLEIEFNVYPDDVKITFNGRVLSSKNTEATRGEYTYKIEKDGYVSKEGTVFVDENKQISHTLLAEQSYQDMNIYVTTDMHPEVESSIGTRTDRWKEWFWMVEKINTDKPDLVIELGDHASDHSGKENMDWERFFEGWNNIDPSIPKIFVPGNHETRNYSHDDLVSVYEEIEPGISDRPLNGNERFNFVHSQNGIDFLALSANYKENGSQSNGYITQSTFDWIENVLLNTDKNMVIICSHYGAHQNHLGDMSEQLLAIIENAIEVNDNLNVVKSIYGHSHPPSNHRRRTNMNDFIGYNLAAGDNGYWCTIEKRSNSLKVETHPLQSI